MPKYISEAAYNEIVKRKIIANAQKTFYKNNPDVYQRFVDDWNYNFDPENRITPLSNFERSLMNAVEDYGKLTEKQLAALRKHWAERDERKKNYQEKEAARIQDVQEIELEEGRQTITGKIVSSKIKETQFGTVTKMVIQDENGWRFYGTMPSALKDQIRELGFSYRTDNGDSNKKLKALTLQFDAQVSHGKEKGFSFFSRPTKAKIVE